MTTKQETIQIEGMSCNHCVSSVTNALTATEGVSVENVEIGKAQVSYNPEQVSQAQLVEVVEDLGFTVKNEN